MRHFSFPHHTGYDQRGSAKAVTESSSALRPDSEPLGSGEIRSLAIIIACGLLVRMALFIGYQGFDDRTYISYAWYVAHGGSIVRADLLDHWIGRPGAWVPMAVAIKLFGNAEWVYCLYSLVTSLASFVVLFVLGRFLLGPRTALYGAALLVFLPIDVFYGTRAYADEALGLWNVAAFTAFVFAVRYGGTWPAILTGLLTGVAFATKETSLLIAVPFILILLQYRVFSVHSLALIVTGFLAAFSLELIFWQVATGDAFYRFHALAAMRHEVVPASRAVTTFWDWIPGPPPGTVVRSGNSVAEAVLVFLTKADWGLLFFYVFPIAMAALIGKNTGRKTLAIFVLSIAALLLFFPVFFPYFTLPRDPRYFTIISIPALLLFADWALNLRRPLRVLAFGSLLLSWIPCLYVGWVSSSIDTDRAFAAYVKHDAKDTVWMGNLDASNVIILSGFDPTLKIGILAPPGARASGVLSQAMSSPNRAMKPDALIARTPYDLKGQLVAFSDNSPAGEGWTLTRTFSARPALVARYVQQILTAFRVPKIMVDKVAPSQGKTIRLFRTADGP